MKSVCKGCEERYAACWGSCPKYIVAKEAYEKRKKAHKKYTILNDLLDSVHYTGFKYERNNRRQKK